MLSVFLYALVLVSTSTSSRAVQAAEYSSAMRYVHMVEHRPTLGPPSSNVEISFCVNAENDSLGELLSTPSIRNFYAHSLAVKCGYRWFDRNALQIVRTEDINKTYLHISLQLPATEWHEIWLHQDDGLHHECEVFLRGQKLRMNQIVSGTKTIPLDFIRSHFFVELII